MKICVTGHRPNKLYGYNLSDIRWQKLKEQFKTILVENDCTEAITGMALEVDISTLEHRIDSYRIANDFLKNTVNIIDKYKVNNNHQIIDAIKYAMKKSHPDNGGNAEDFKKFRDLYNSMK